MSAMRLDALAEALGAQLQGSPEVMVSQVATIHQATAGTLTFLANPRYSQYLSDCQASAVILSPANAADWQGNALIVPNPYLAYARAAALLHPLPQPEAGIHPSAEVHPSAELAEDVRVGPLAVVGPGVVVGAGSSIGARCVLDAGVQIGEGCWLGPSVTILHDCVLGNRVMVESGTVIGSEGFGWARDGSSWVKVPQLGRVVIGDDVAIGANCCLDRGAIEDTMIAAGVKLDNLIQVAHNVVIGQDTAIAGSAAIAGSTRIGARCTLAGKVGVTGHLQIADDVHVTAMTLVTHDLNVPGVYSGSLPVDDNPRWRRNAARFRQLDALTRRIQQLEKQLAAINGDAQAAPSD